MRAVKAIKTVKTDKPTKPNKPKPNASKPMQKWSRPKLRPEPVSKRRLRAWIRLLRVTRATEGQLREYLRQNHATTLPRFDVLAELSRCPEGVTMSELSRMLLVSNGNATTVVERLVAEQLVRRRIPATDRRAVVVSLTAQGRQLFARLAQAHEREVSAIFAGLPEADLDTLSSLLHDLLNKTGKGATAKT